ncbi:MAG TPA: histidine kinase, partial [Lachnospiraceae bacterium]|nr:histidine kinase [Lachnospiraceae bacterium]
ALWEIFDGVNTTKISLEYDVEGTLPNPIKYAFIAIVKEAVNNIQKHSNAKNASIRVCMHPGFYLLSIADNGTKISTTDSRGIGLSNMEERVRALNGVIRFDTENGFKITIIIRR